jgi:hypothetical protein
MPLRPRQTRLYRHRVNLYEPVAKAQDVTTNEVTPNGGYTLRYSNVACLLHFTQNVSDPIEGLGQAKRAILGTFDGVHFVLDQECEEGWLVQYILTGPLQNQLWICKGTPQLVDGIPNYRGFNIGTVEGVPTGVVLV